MEMDVSNFKTYDSYEFQVDTSKLSNRGLLFFLVTACLIVCFIAQPFIFGFSSIPLWQVIAPLILAVGFGSYGCICFNKEEGINTSDYFDYLDGCGIGEVDLFNASKSPEYSDTSKAKIALYLNARKQNWSIKYPELWSTAP